MPRPEDSYDTGYKKPPAAHRFKPGQSGNPNGRKKASKALSQILEDELTRTVSVREGDTVTKLTMAQAAIRSLIAQGISKGKTGALNRLLQMIEKVSEIQQQSVVAAQTSEAAITQKQIENQQELCQHVIFDFLDFISDEKSRGNNVDRQAENLQKLMDSWKT